MLGLLLDKLAAAEGRLRVNQLVRAEGRAALLALVAIGALCAAARAGAGDVAVSEEGLGLLVIVLLAHLLYELALLIELPEEVRGVLVVSLRRCPRIYVEVDSESCE